MVSCISPRLAIGLLNPNASYLHISGPGEPIPANTQVYGVAQGKIEEKQGRIHGNPVADGWAGAIMQKSLAISEIFRTDGRTDGPTDRHGKV